MSERVFRILLGLWLLAAMVLDSKTALYAFLGLLLLEGMTNLRVPKVVNWMRTGRLEVPEDHCCAEADARVSFEAERALRFIVALFVAVPVFLFNERLWWMPWFVGFALVGAGLSGICPMVLALRKLGLR